MTEEKKCVFDFNAEELIQLKDMTLKTVEEKYFNLLAKERDLKNTENRLWLKTDFKDKGLTNDSLRRAFVSDNTSELRFKVDTAKYELKQQENNLIIINDLLSLRMQEVKTE